MNISPLAEISIIAAIFWLTGVIVFRTIKLQQKAKLQDLHGATLSIKFALEQMVLDGKVSAEDFMWQVAISVAERLEENPTTMTIPALAEARRVGSEVKPEVKEAFDRAFKESPKELQDIVLKLSKNALDIALTNSPIWAGLGVIVYIIFATLAAIVEPVRGFKERLDAFRHPEKAPSESLAATRKVLCPS